MKLSLKGHVEIKVGRNNLSLHNDVAPEFALLLAKTMLAGASTGTTYSSGVALPTGVVIVLLNNNAVVTTISTNVTKFSDSLSGSGETTSVTFVGSDATPTEVTFNALELYTVVGQTLYLRIAYANLESPVTKDVNDVVQVTWVEEISSGGSLISFQNTQSACSQCSSTCNTSLLKEDLTTSSIANFLWALLIVPALNKVAVSTSTPMSQYVTLFYTYYLTNNKVPQIEGVSSIFLTDQCLNVVETVQVVAPIITYSTTNDEAIVSLALYINPSSNVYYALPVFTITNVFSAFLGLVQVSNTSGISSGQLSIVVQIPYGSPTLQSLTVNE